MCRASDRPEAPPAQLKGAIDRFPGWLRVVGDSALGEQLIELREGIDRLEAVFADGLRRFDKSGEYQADGALSAVAWLRWKCRLSGGAAAERVGIARQLEQLPKIEQAFARGEVGYQQVAVLARTAEHVGAQAVRQEEGTLLQAAQTMDAGQFSVEAKKFEHKIDAEWALEEANRAYARRYLMVGQPLNGLVRLDGLLDAEAGATLQTALNALMTPSKGDERTTTQRRADALVELCRRQLDGGKLPQVGGQRPHLMITASRQTLTGGSGHPAGELAWADTIPTETVRRLSCDAGLSQQTADGATPETRTIPAATRRAWSSAIGTVRFRGATDGRAGRMRITWCTGRTRENEHEQSRLALPAAPSPDGARRPLAAGARQERPADSGPSASEGSGLASLAVAVSEKGSSRAARRVARGCGHEA